MFTKEQRHRIYSEALVKLKHEIETRPYMTYICPTLKRIANDYFDSEITTYDNFEEAFPEFVEFKPDGLDCGNSWWCTDSSGNRQRIRALEKCIEQTKP